MVMHDRQRLRAAGKTIVGKVRPRNEDAILVREEIGLYVVADGMGGHAAGDVASTMIVARLESLPPSSGLDALQIQVEAVLQQVNRDLRTLARQLGVVVIGSTVAVLLCDGVRTICGWAGDSRIYRLLEGNLQQLTRDHVIGEQQATGRRIGPVGALTRAVGACSRLEMEWLALEHGAGTRYLLCSDGLNNDIGDAGLEAILRQCESPSDGVRRLFERISGGEGRDNISAILVQGGLE